LVLLAAGMGSRYPRVEANKFIKQTANMPSAKGIGGQL